MEVVIQHVFLHLLSCNCFGFIAINLRYRLFLTSATMNNIIYTTEAELQKPHVHKLEHVVYYQRGTVLHIIEHLFLHICMGSLVKKRSIGWYYVGRHAYLRNPHR